jgi:Ni,Fe-hydrogenase III large subunit
LVLSAWLDEPPLDGRVAHPCVEVGDGFSAALRTGGDVLARFEVRVEEVRKSLSLLAHFIGRAGPLESVVTAGGAVNPSGVGIAEAWRGTLVHRLELRADGHLTRVKVVDPSFFNWPALPVSLADTIVPDFPLANKSFNLSYAGNAL